MDDLVGFLFFLLVFVIGPLLGQAKKNKQQPPPPPRRHPLPTDMRTGLPDPGRPSGEGTQRQQTAADMVPEELWAVLTGQPVPPRPGHPPAPPPRETVPGYDESDHEEEEATAVVEARSMEDVDYEQRRARVEEVSLERAPARVMPYVVSMEEPPLKPAARHTAFHQRMIDTAPPAEAARSAIMLDLSPGQLRRAFVLQVVLGKPKALE